LAMSEVAMASGFADQSHFCRQFRKLVGTTPSRYRRSTRQGRQGVAVIQVI